MIILTGSQTLPMGKLVNLIGSGIGLAVEISKSNSNSPGQGQSSSLAVQNRSVSRPQSRGSGFRDTDYNGNYEEYHSKSTLRNGSRQLQQDERQIGDDYRVMHSDERDTWERDYPERTSRNEKQRNEKQQGMDEEAIYMDEPPSYTTATGATKSSPYSSSSSLSARSRNSPTSKTSVPQTTSYRSDLYYDTDSAASLRSPPRGGLQLPVIIPQRRPEDKSRGWMLCYAPMLETCNIDQAEFLNFLRSFNEASKVSLPLF